MKSIPLADAAARVSEITRVLTDGGLACFPLGGTYRLAADARNEAAITRLAQSKRRAKNHPALVLVGDLASARTVVHGTAWPTTKRLAQQFWPGPLTLALPPSTDLPGKVGKLLARATGTIGVRVTDDPLAKAIVQSFSGPIVLSSANLEKKPGASSASAVQQRFVTSVDIWVDAGELAAGVASTIVEVDEDAWKITREGAVPRDKIEAVLA